MREQKKITIAIFSTTSGFHCVAKKNYRKMIQILFYSGLQPDLAKSSEG
jgi:hypothetical protein